VRPPIQDPTAGVSARAIREDPGAPRVIRDPTDPHCGELSQRSGERGPDRPRILDPTDPECGEEA
jgi:hypothetical protein